MTILNELNTEDKKSEEYYIPSVYRNSDKEPSFISSIVLSTILHPVAVGLLWLLLFAAAILGITFVTFQKPDTKPHDLEFVLVDREETPIDKNTRFRSDRNSRAGGKHDPKRKVSMPSPAGGSGVKKTSRPKAVQSAPQQSKKTPDKKLTDNISKLSNRNKNAGQSVTKPEPAKTHANKPAPKPGKPAVPNVTTKPKSNFVIPVPTSNIPNIGMPAGSGPVTSKNGTGTGATSGSGKSGSGSRSGSKLSFAPVTSGGGSGSGKGGTGTSGYGSGRGNVGNPGPGNPNGRPGIDALKEPDFGPYMRNLQQRIKRNWEPPRGEESRRVVLLFGISKDGRLTSLRIHKSSGLESADKAAMEAVRLSAPFAPLPAEYKENTVDIQFTFDYNVFGAKKY